MRRRGMDHIVHAVQDLEAAREAYARLGFTLTPYATHPWGTRNFLVQLDGVFLEILEVVDPSLMEAADVDAFSFGAYNRDFLAAGEGMSMLVLDSESPAADRASFQDAGLITYAPFSFERIARQPDGEELKVAFDLTFTTHPDMPDAAFFTCHNRYPENFWKVIYQQHSNSAVGVAGVILAAERPADLHKFIEGFAGARDLTVTSFGFECKTARGTLHVMTPEGVRALYGDIYPLDALSSPRLIATLINVRDTHAFAGIAHSSGIAVRQEDCQVIISSGDLHGMAMIAQQAK
ncbi:VOC family protein [Breoghania sp.]|uniref:VOC family protein n=1 Tax=Breoghania sp. TaxID=2065378 RepID=UPI002AAA8319|nr:VOC family protein [Breoghania sp.]